MTPKEITQPEAGTCAKLQTQFPSAADDLPIVSSEKFPGIVPKSRELIFLFGGKDGMIADKSLDQKEQHGCC